MPDEEIDKIVRDAAHQHHPPYDDKAWGKMELLLDEHLPQKKDRKRPILFLFFFLLLGTVLFFATKKYQAKNNTVVAESTNNPAAEKNTAATTITSSSNNNENTISKNHPKADQQAAANQPAATNTNTSATVKTFIPSNINSSSADKNENDEQFNERNKKSRSQKSRLAIKIKKPAATSDDAITGNTTIKNTRQFNGDNGLRLTAKTPAAVNETNEEEADEVNELIAKEQIAATEKTKDSAAKIPTTAATEKKKADSSIAATGSKKPQKKSGKNFAANIAITVSYGADVSFIDINNPGKLKPVYGAGLSYALGKYFTVSSGLYVSKKIYSAPPSQYKFTGAVSYPYLVKIDGDCNIYEIPLYISYNFKPGKKHNWLAAAGLSSLLMKKESYDYIYQIPSGQSYNYVHAVANENQHYFSVLTVSAGYQYKLSNRIAITAEPYLKLPLTGIGAGNVKLNSTGILLTGSVKPFAKRKK